MKTSTVIFKNVQPIFISDPYGMEVGFLSGGAHVETPAQIAKVILSDLLEKGALRIGEIQTVKVTVEVEEVTPDATD